MKYQVLLLLKATPRWLGLSYDYRQKIFDQLLQPLFSQFVGQLQIRLYNSEGFHAGISDVITIETESLESYQVFLQQLKSSKIFSEEYFEMKDVIAGKENGFQGLNEAWRKERKTMIN